MDALTLITIDENENTWVNFNGEVFGITVDNLVMDDCGAPFEPTESDRMLINLRDAGLSDLVGVKKYGYDIK